MTQTRAQTRAQSRAQSRLQIAVPDGLDPKEQDTEQDPSRPLPQIREIRQRPYKRQPEATMDKQELTPAGPFPKRRRVSASPTPGASKPVASDTCDADKPIETWRRQGSWPRSYFEPTAVVNISPREATPSSNSGGYRHMYENRSADETRPDSWSKASSMRDGRDIEHSSPRFKNVLESKGVFTTPSSLGASSESLILCKSLLEGEQPYPEKSLFQDDVFSLACSKLIDANKARIVQDITRLLIPSAEGLASFGAKHLAILEESVGEVWTRCTPLVGPRPQPDYAVGFARGAFTPEQLQKLSPFLGDVLFNDQTRFLATYSMYLPFLVCEVKSSDGNLAVAHRQNVHSMTAALQGLVSLYRLLGRQKEIHREILGFSISHDNRQVVIQGHYPVIDGRSVEYYSHEVFASIFASPGADRWATYRFTRNVYDIWMPIHLNRICSVLDQLSSEGTSRTPDVLPEECEGTAAPPTKDDEQLQIKDFLRPRPFIRMRTRN